MKNIYVMLTAALFSMQATATSIVVLDPATDEIIINPSEAQMDKALKDLGMEEGHLRALESHAGEEQTKAVKTTIMVEGEPVEVESFKFEH